MVEGNAATAYCLDATALSKSSSIRVYRAEESREKKKKSRVVGKTRQQNIQASQHRKRPVCSHVCSSDYKPRLQHQSPAKKSCPSAFVMMHDRNDRGLPTLSTISSASQLTYSKESQQRFPPCYTLDPALVPRCDR